MQASNFHLSLPSRLFFSGNLLLLKEERELEELHQTFFLIIIK
jgi:hypothetical protein